VVWMYVVHEFEDALMDCNDVALKDNDNAVHAWDEGVAFYTGSLEGPLGDGAGQLLHALADKRCANFDTCGSNGTSSVNSKLEGLFQQGEKAMAQGKCDEGALILEQIKPLMTIPLIQGALRYAYKSADGKGGAKEIAEGWAFAAAVLPQVDAASPAAAAFIRTNMEYGAAKAVVDGYEAVFEAFESVYAALGVTCEDIGHLQENSKQRTCSTDRSWSAVSLTSAESVAKIIVGFAEELNAEKTTKLEDGICTVYATYSKVDRSDVKCVATKTSRRLRRLLADVTYEVEVMANPVAIAHLVANPVQASDLAKIDADVVTKSAEWSIPTPTSVVAAPLGAGMTPVPCSNTVNIISEAATPEHAQNALIKSLQGTITALWVFVVINLLLTASVLVIFFRHKKPVTYSGVERIQVSSRNGSTSDVRK